MAKAISAMIMDFWNPKKMTFWIILIMLLFGAGAYYWINKASVGEQKRINDIPNAPSTKVTVMMFTVDWCPHCKKAKTPWEDFVKAYDGKIVKNRLVQCKTHNLTDANENDPISTKYKIDGYPTIKMEKDGQIIEFDAKVTTYSLERFVEDMI